MPEGIKQVEARKCALGWNQFNPQVFTHDRLPINLSIRRENEGRNYSRFILIFLSLNSDLGSLPTVSLPLNPQFDATLPSFFLSCFALSPATQLTFLVLFIHFPETLTSQELIRLSFPQRCNRADYSQLLCTSNNKYYHRKDKDTSRKIRCEQMALQRARNENYCQGS